MAGLQWSSSVRQSLAVRQKELSEWYRLILKRQKCIEIKLNPCNFLLFFTSFCSFFYFSFLFLYFLSFFLFFSPFFCLQVYDRNGLYDKMGLQLKALKARALRRCQHLASSQSPFAACQIRRKPSKRDKNIILFENTAQCPSRTLFGLISNLRTPVIASMRRIAKIMLRSRSSAVRYKYQYTHVNVLLRLRRLCVEPHLNEKEVNSIYHIPTG